MRTRFKKHQIPTNNDNINKFNWQDTTLYVAITSGLSTLIGYQSDIMLLRKYNFSESSAEFFVLNPKSMSALYFFFTVAITIFILCEVPILSNNKMQKDKELLERRTFLTILFGMLGIPSTIIIQDLFDISNVSFFLLVFCAICFGAMIALYLNSEYMRKYVYLPMIACCFIPVFAIPALTAYGSTLLESQTINTRNNENYFLVKDYHTRLLLAGFNYTDDCVITPNFDLNKINKNLYSRSIKLNNNRRIVPMDKANDWVFRTETLQITD